jgi:hypothetical protein
LELVTTFSNNILLSARILLPTGSPLYRHYEQVNAFNTNEPGLNS